jgi:hypothetical protein
MNRGSGQADSAIENMMGSESGNLEAQTDYRRQ